MDNVTWVWYCNTVKIFYYVLLCLWVLTVTEKAKWCFLFLLTICGQWPPLNSACRQSLDAILFFFAGYLWQKLKWNVKGSCSQFSRYLTDCCKLLQPVGFVTFSSRVAAETAKQDLQVSYSQWAVLPRHLSLTSAKYSSYTVKSLSILDAANITIKMFWCFIALFAILSGIIKRLLKSMVRMAKVTTLCFRWSLEIQPKMRPG